MCLCTVVCMKGGKFFFVFTDLFKCLNGKNHFHAIFHSIKTKEFYKSLKSFFLILY